MLAIQSIGEPILTRPRAIPTAQPPEMAVFCCLLVEGWFFFGVGNTLNDFRATSKAEACLGVGRNVGKEKIKRKSH